MYKLYHRPNSGSAAVEALCAELGVPLELVQVPRLLDKSIPDWFKAINPRGEVPTLALPDGTVMTESAAIMIYLADRHRDSQLAPPTDDPLRACYLRWMVFFATAPYTADLRLFYPERYSTDSTHADGIKARAIIDLNRDFDQFADALGSGPFILGEQFSAVDIYAAMLISWSEDMTALFARLPNLQNLYIAVTSRPAIAPVWARNT
jgi:glutathione S-transferase